MTSLESIVLPLEQSRALVEHGIVLDTAMVWVGLWGVDGHWHVQSRESIEMLRAQPELDRVENGATLEDRGLVTLSAPTAGEMEEWLIIKHPNATISTFRRGELGIDVDIDDDVANYHQGVGQYPTIVAAFSALVLEVAG